MGQGQWNNNNTAAICCFSFYVHNGKSFEGCLFMSVIFKEARGQVIKMAERLAIRLSALYSLSN